MVSKQVMLKKKGKRKSKKTTTTTKATASSRVINNIHINSKSGTRSKRQQRGGVGGYAAPSAASTISHVPLVMNVPAPDTTQRETQFIHAIKNVQDDIVALRALSAQAALQRQERAPNPADTNRFQPLPSRADEQLAATEQRAEDIRSEFLKRSKSEPSVLPERPEAQARPKKGRPRKSGVQEAIPVNAPLPSQAPIQPLQQRKVKDIASFFEPKK
jgi:hypothetical protein